MTKTTAHVHSMLGSFIVPIAQALRQCGEDPVAVVAKAGIDLAKGANPDWRVGQRQFDIVLTHCVTVTGDEAFGLLGFSEPSTFSRAFKRWTGMAPADYREAELQAPWLT